MEDPSRARWLGRVRDVSRCAVLGTVDVCQIHAASQRSKNRHSIVGCECCRTITQGLIEPRKTWVGAVIGAPEYGRGAIGRRAFISMRGKWWRCFE